MTQEDPLAAVEAARAKIDALVAEAESRKDATKNLADELHAVSAQARSPRGEVMVVAQPSGRIESVIFAVSAEELGAAELTRLTTLTIAEAQHKAALAALELSARTLGEDSPAFEQLRGEALAAFPEPGGSDMSSIGYR